VRLQKYNSTSHKATNKYYVDGKLVTNQDRFMCETTIDEAPHYSLAFTEKTWEK